jgi:hypothetical protein
MSPIYGLPLLVTLAAAPAMGEGCGPLACAAEAGWRATIASMLPEFMACKVPIDDRSPCNFFVARALERVYDVADLRSPGQTESYLPANAIARFVRDNPGLWEDLGTAEDLSKRRRAQQCANAGRPALAVEEGAGHGHVALLLPGFVRSTGSWGGEVPCSASFFLDRPQQSFVGCPLSYAFTDPSRARLYCRRF